MEKRKYATKDQKQDKKQRKSKDPNQPKRPPSAFFVFMEEFRKTYKEMHPDVKSVSTIGKAGGHKWNEMSEEEKAPYVSVAADKKVQYEKNMTAYRNKGLAAEHGPQQGSGCGESNEDEGSEDEE